MSSLNIPLVIALTGMIFLTFYQGQTVQASPFFSNGYFTPNGIEWCEENWPLYEVLGDRFFEHHNHSLESRVCVSLYYDYYWTYEGSDRVEKLIERSKYYSQLEISESYEESMTGIIDTNPAENKNQTLLQGTTNDGNIMVQIIASTPKKNQSMEMNLAFFDKFNKLIPNVNYGINVTQQGEKILENNSIYSEKGLSTLITRPLNSEEQISIIVKVNGSNFNNNLNDILEFDQETIEFTVIPEFGEFAIIFLGIAISITIIVKKKNNLPIFRMKI